MTSKTEYARIRLLANSRDFVANHFGRDAHDRVLAALAPDAAAQLGGRSPSHATCVFPGDAGCEWELAW